MLTHTRCFLASTIVLLAATPVASLAGDPRPPRGQRLEEQTRRLIPQLSDPQRSRREAAASQLEALGSDVLPLLERAVAAAQGETGWRLRMLRGRLTERAVAEAIEPSPVVASPAGTPVTQAFEKLMGSPGGRIVVDEASMGEAVLTAAGPASGISTYAEELERLLAASGSRIDAVATAAGGLQIRRLHAGEPAPIATAAGPLRVEVLQAALVPTGQPRAARVTLRVIWEPRLRPVMLQLPMASLIAEGEAGEVVPPKQRAAVVEASPQGSAGWVTTPLLLAAPPASVESIASLRGTLELWVPAGDIDVPLPIGEGLAGAARQEAGDANVQLESCLIGSNTLTVRARVDYPATEALASHRTWLTSRLLSCTIGEQSLTALSDRVVRRDSRGLTREAVFALPAGVDPEAVRGELHWRLPLAIRSFPVDFLLRDISLPYSSDATRRNTR